MTVHRVRNSEHLADLGVPLHEEDVDSALLAAVTGHCRWCETEAPLSEDLLCSRCLEEQEIGAFHDDAFGS